MDATVRVAGEPKERLVSHLKAELVKLIRTPIYRETLEKREEREAKARSSSPKLGGDKFHTQYTKDPIPIEILRDPDLNSEENNLKFNKGDKLIKFNRPQEIELKFETKPA